jgi:uncharacterized protein YgiM (DUF1202 family)
LLPMIRQQVTFILLLGLVLAFLAGSPKALADTPARVISPDAPLKRLPERSANTITTLALDTSVFVVKRQGDWVYVAVPLTNQKGWIVSRVLSLSQGPPSGGDSAVAKGSGVEVKTKQESQKEEEPEAKGEAQESSKPAVPELDPDHATEFQPEHAPIAVITGSNVNVREKPDLKSKVLDNLTDGTKVYLVSVSGPWYYVSVPSKELKGFVFGTYIFHLEEVVITGDDVNLRSGPTTDAEVVQVISKGERFVRLGETKGFYRVVSPTKGFEGWVSKDFAKLAAPEMPCYKVVGNVVNFRETPNVDAEIIVQLNAGAEVKAVGRDEKWSLVEVSGRQGWIYSEYLVPSGMFNTAAGRDIGSRLASRGLELRGVRYRWGGESPNGFDCSGFVYFLLRDQFGLHNLPRRASEQYYQMGTAVDKEDLAVGDLVFFTTYKAGPSHVGVYIGDGNFVHASSAGGQVQINSLSEGYYKKRLVGARRITNKDLDKYGEG